MLFRINSMGKLTFWANRKSGKHYRVLNTMEFTLHVRIRKFHNFVVQKSDMAGFILSKFFCSYGFRYTIFCWKFSKILKQIVSHQFAWNIVFLWTKNFIETENDGTFECTKKNASSYIADEKIAFNVKNGIMNSLRNFERKKYFPTDFVRCWN